MAERNLDFDTIIDRTNTHSLKYDFAKRRGVPENLTSMWVADMDFRISSYIQDAIIDSANHGIYGYSETKEEYFAVVKEWMKKRYDWELEDERWLVKTPGIVFALAMAVKAYTEVGDAVLIQQPVYYPFSEVIEDNDRIIVSNTLVDNGSGRYSIDFNDFEQKIVDNNIKLFLLCNPHNPGGSVWTEDELVRMGDICLRHGVIVVSDEIHADFVWNGKHHVFANLKKEFKDITVTCTSPTKTFNIAGFQISNILIPNRELKRKFKHQVYAAGYSQVGTLGIIACIAAYEHGEEWLEAVKKYIKGNLDYTKDFIQNNIPELKMFYPEGTYLVWIDCSQLGLSDVALNDLIIKKARLWLDSGEIFGTSGSGFQRINVACPRAILEKALTQLADAVQDIRG